MSMSEPELSRHHDSSIPYFQLDSRLDYQCLAREVIRALRGSLRQRELSEKLGYTFNQVGKWESGATQIKWDDFLRLGNTAGTDMEKFFRYSFWIKDLEFNAYTSLKSLESAIGLHAIKDPSIQLIRRKWLKGAAMPDLADVLKLMGTQLPVLLGWLSLFIDCKTLPTLRGTYAAFLQSLDSIFSRPHIAYVNAALQLEVYKDLSFHDENLLAEHSACSVSELREALKTLISYGLITYDGKIYHPCPFDFSFAGLRHPKLRGLTKISTDLVARRYPLQPIQIDSQKVQNACRSSVRVKALSKGASQQIAELIAKFHNEVGEVVRGDHGPKTNVQVILIHSFTSNFNSDPK